MKILFFANTDWYLFNFRLALAKALKTLGHEVIMMSPPGSYGKRLIAEGFRWEPIGMKRRSLNPFRELLLLWWLWRFVTRERPDVIHSFTIKCVIYGSIVARLAGVRRINAVTGLGHVFTSKNYKAMILRPLVRLLLRFAFFGEGVRLIVQNPDDRQLMLDAGLVNATTVCLIGGSGVDTIRFHPSACEQRLPLQILLATRLLWDKGISEFVEAARQLRRSGIDADFVIAGAPDSGNPAAVDCATIAKWEAEKVVRFLGHRDDMERILSCASIVVLPSYREGLPRILIEAAACGLAIVTTDVPGCREAVQHEYNGLLVPARNSVALGVAIGRLIADTDLRQRLGKAGRQRALDEFDERHIIAATMAVYRSIVCDEQSGNVSI